MKFLCRYAIRSLQISQMRGMFGILSLTLVNLCVIFFSLFSVNVVVSCADLDIIFHLLQGLVYKPGDVLAVMPSQREEDVDAFLSRSNLDPDLPILVSQ